MTSLKAAIDIHLSDATAPFKKSLAARSKP